MKFKILMAALLSLCVRARADAPVFSQEKLGEKIIHEILHGDTASTAALFEDSVRPNLTREVLKNIQSQIDWLSKLIGDTLDQFMTGTHADTAHHETSFFREYRLANELNKRAPLIVVHIWFKDSTADKAAGAFVKTFLENSEKQIAGAQTWKVGGKNVDVDAVVLVGFKQGGMLAIKVFDDDTTTLDTNVAQKKGVPIIRKAIAEGLLKKAKAALQGDTLLGDIGVAFIRKDPHFGYTHFKYGIAARYFTGPSKSKPRNTRLP